MTTPANRLDVDRRHFVQTAALAAAGFAIAPRLAWAGSSAMPGKDDVLRQIPLQHDATVTMLRDWIALPSIAGENLGYPQGAEYMARLARDAGFQRVEVIPTKGKPGVFATLDAGAEKTVGLYFMYDVKQYDPAEWSSPPLESRLVDRPGRPSSTASTQAATAWRRTGTDGCMWALQRRGG